jgi:hypothetical protein
VRAIYRAIKKLVVRVTGGRPPSPPLAGKEPVAGFSGD